MKGWMNALLFSAALTLAADNSERGKNMERPPAAVTCLQVPDD